MSATSVKIIKKTRVVRIARVGTQGRPGDGVVLSDAAPAALGAASPGTGPLASREDHAHAMPTAAQVGADPAGTATTTANAAQAAAAIDASNKADAAEAAAIAAAAIDASAKADAARAAAEAASVPTTALGVSVATLVGGLLPTAFLPPMAITEFLLSSADQAAMLAKVGQKGDWTIRTDTGAVWIIVGNDPTQLANWQALSYPGAPVLTVNGQAGTVVLGYADVGADAFGAATTAQAAAIAAAALDATSKANAAQAAATAAAAIDATNKANAAQAAAATDATTKANAAQAAAATDATTKADAAQAAATAAAAADATTKANAAQAAAQAYADGLVVGLLDDRGGFDASGNVFPSAGGSGAAGAVLKGDLWTISVAGTLGGTAVTAGDVVRAIANAPGQTAGNWTITENNIGYVPEAAQTAVSQAEAEAGTGTVKRSWTPERVWQAITARLTLGTWISGATSKATPVDADTLSMSDSAASNVLKKLTWANLKATLRTAFDLVYGLLGTANTWTAQNIFARGSIATTSPLTITQTWNGSGVSFTSLLVNVTDTASAAASYLLDLQVAGVSLASVTKGGKISAYTGYYMRLDTTGSIGLEGWWGGSFRVLQLTANQGYALVSMDAGGSLNWASATLTTATPDLVMARAGPNMMCFTGAAIGLVLGGGYATSRVEGNKAVTGIADATATAVFTLTIPNAAHSASCRVKLVGSLGAGGAIGAREATATVEYDVVVTRMPGLNAVAAISAAFGSSAVAVAGAATVTVTGDLGAVSGAAGAVNTITIRVTITKSGGASANHLCLAFCELLNAAGTGITIA